jgi:hypothetical protein
MAGGQRNFTLLGQNSNSRKEIYFYVMEDPFIGMEE